MLFAMQREFCRIRQSSGCKVLESLPPDLAAASDSVEALEVLLQAKAAVKAINKTSQYLRSIYTSDISDSIHPSVRQTAELVQGFNKKSWVSQKVVF